MLAACSCIGPASNTLLIAGRVSPAHQDKLAAAPSKPCMSLGPSFIKVDGCDLCRAAHITPWYYEDEICWIAECDICEVPMVVWRFHGTEPPPEHLSHMHRRIRDVGATRFGEFYIDDHMRNIPDHYHAHARPRGGFFGHDARR